MPPCLFGLCFFLLLPCLLWRETVLALRLPPPRLLKLSCLRCPNEHGHCLRFLSGHLQVPYTSSSEGFHGNALLMCIGQRFSPSLLRQILQGNLHPQDMKKAYLARFDYFGNNEDAVPQSKDSHARHVSEGSRPSEQCWTEARSGRFVPSRG